MLLPASQRAAEDYFLMTSPLLRKQLLLTSYSLQQMTDVLLLYRKRVTAFPTRRRSLSCDFSPPKKASYFWHHTPCNRWPELFYFAGNASQPSQREEGRFLWLLTSQESKLLLTSFSFRWRISLRSTESMKNQRVNENNRVNENQRVNENNGVNENQRVNENNRVNENQRVNENLKNRWEQNAQNLPLHFDLILFSSISKAQELPRL